jgi:hypothetical protein
MTQTSPWILVLGPLLGGTLAGIFALTVTYLGHRFTAGRERAAKSSESKMKRLQRWEEFETKNLLDLQDTAPRLIEAIRKLHSDLIHETPPKSRFADVLAVEGFLIHVVNLASRVRDQELRTHMKAFIEAAVALRDALNGPISQLEMPDRLRNNNPVDHALFKKMTDTMITHYLTVSSIIGDRIRSEIEAAMARTDAGLARN